MMCIEGVKGAGLQEDYRGKQGGTCCLQNQTLKTEILKQSGERKLKYFIPEAGRM